MKYIKNTYILSIIVVCLTTIRSYSQSDSISTELNKTVKVYSEYKPQISDVVRISANPQAYDTLDLKVNLNYSIDSKPVATAYTIKPIKAVSVKGDKLPELYRGYAEIALGNYSTSLINIKYMTERSRTKQAGVELYHFGTFGRVTLPNNIKTPASNTNDYLFAYAKKNFEKSTVSASFKPQFQSVLKYGYLPLSEDKDSVVADTSLIKKDIRKNIGTISTKLGIQSTISDKDCLKYKADFEDVVTILNPKSIENSISASSEFTKQFDDIKSGADITIQTSNINFNPLDTSLKKYEINIQALPYVGTSIDNWTVRIGIKASEAIGSNAFKAYPDILFNYKLLNYSLIPYFKYSGSYNTYSLHQIVAENPFITDYTMLKPTNNKMILDFGAQGKIARSIPYKYSCIITNFENQYFWINDAIGTDSTFNTFKPVYDNGSKVTLHAETGLKRKYVSIDAALDYNNYTLNTLAKPWHKPGIESSVAFKYNIISPLTNKNKLIVTSKLFYEDLMYAKDVYGNSKKLPALFDVNLHLDYYYNSVLVVYAHINNITGTKYQQLYLYPNQRTNFLIGLNYSFAGHRE